MKGITVGILNRSFPYATCILLRAIMYWSKVNSNISGKIVQLSINERPNDEIKKN